MFNDQGHAHVPVRALDLMKEIGGGFAARLAGLYVVADQPHRDTLVRAFLSEFQYWEEKSADPSVITRLDTYS